MSAVTTSVKLHQEQAAPRIWNFAWVHQVILFTGMGLFPILPVFAGTFRTDPGAVGLFLALVYIAISLGTLVSGRLAPHLGMRKLYLAAGILGVPALLGLAQAATYWQAVLLTGLVWFAGGIGLSLNGVYLGLLVPAERRGRTFGLLSLTSPIGAIAGGAAVARLSAWGGFSTVFTLTAMIWATWPLVAWFSLPRGVEPGSQKSTPVEKPGAGSAGGGATSAEAATAAAPGLRTAFIRLLLAAMLAALAISVGRMGVSLAMKAQHFSVAAISTANIAAGVITLPLIWSSSRLADRLGRRRVLLGSYALAIVGPLILSLSETIWQFWLANGLLMTGYSLASNMASAYAADILPASQLSRRMPVLNTTIWVGGVIGFATSGYMLRWLGMSATFQAFSLLGLISIVLVSLSSWRRKPALPTTDCLGETHAEGSLAPCM